MKKYLALAAAALFASAPASAAVQIVDNGILTGATGVLVNGVSYDVSFLDGECSSVFSGCDAISDFAFGGTDGMAAATSLIDQVFFDSALGSFDSNPALTRGCSGVSLCNAFIPTSFIVSGVSGRAVANYPGGQGNLTPIFSFSGPTLDTSFLAGVTWARFTLSQGVAAVPEPSTWSMMLLGFGGMGVALRRNRRRNTLMQVAKEN